MDAFAKYGELVLLSLLAVVQFVRWSQKTEDAPAGAQRVASEALKKAETVESDLRRHKHAYQDFLNRRFIEMDRVYARRREVELQFEGQDERIEAMKEKVEKFAGA